MSRQIFGDDKRRKNCIVRSYRILHRVEDTTVKVLKVRSTMTSVQVSLPNERTNKLVNN